MLGHSSWDEPIHLVESELKICPIAWGKQRPEHRFIFVGSSTDMFAAEVPAELIVRVLDHLRSHQGGCRCKGRHKDSTSQYLFQTKNPARFLELLDHIPRGIGHRNTWLGTTVETTYSMNNWREPLSNAPETLERLRAMKEIKGKGFEILISVEPIMEMDVGHLVKHLLEVGPTMVSIGADSRSEEDRENRPIPEPLPRHIGGLIVDLENAGIGVHLKKNLGRLIKGGSPGPF